MATVTKSSTADAWIGPTRATSTADAIIAKLGNLKTSTADAYLNKFKFSTADAIIADNRGSFRGEGLVSARDALAPLYAGDTFKVMDDVIGQHMHYFDGSNWSSQAAIQVQESGQARTRRTPTTAGVAAIQGDPSYPLLLNRGATRLFSVDNSGNLYANSEMFGSAASLNANDSITLPLNVTYTTPVMVQSASARVTGGTTLTTAWPGSTAAGSLLVCAINVEGTATATTPTGFTSSGSGFSGSNRFYFFYRENCSAAEASVVSTISASSNAQMAIMEVSGIATSSSLDLSASASIIRIDNHNFYVQPGSATTQTLEVWITAIGTSNSGNLSDPTNGFILAQTKTSGPSTGAVALFYQIVSSTGTLNHYASTVGNITGVTPSGVQKSFKAIGSTISSPAAGSLVLYAKASGGVARLYYKDEGGTEHGPL